MEFRLISRARDGFRVTGRFISRRGQEKKKKGYSHPRGTMLRLRDMLPRVTSPRALIRSVFRPRGRAQRVPRPRRSCMCGGTVNYFYKIARPYSQRCYSFGNKLARGRVRINGLKKKSPARSLFFWPIWIQKIRAMLLKTAPRGLCIRWIKNGSVSLNRLTLTRQKRWSCKINF